MLKVFQEKFVLAQLYTDGGSFQEANRELQMERFNTLALPFYVVVNANDQEIRRHAGIIPDLKDFLTFLEFWHYFFTCLNIHFFADELSFFVIALT